MDIKEKYINIGMGESVSFISGRIDPADKKLYAFKEVLDDFQAAKHIRISSYTISSYDNDYLLSLLYNLTQAEDIKVIVGVPSYYSRNDNKKKYQKYEDEIKKYVRLLSPKKFKSSVKIGINAFNHSKMIGTDDVLYVGSQNYSYKSREKFDAGVIIRNKSAIKTIYDCGYEEIWENSYILAGDEYKTIASYGLLSEFLKLLMDSLSQIYVEKIDMESLFDADSIFIEENFSSIRRIIKDFIIVFSELTEFEPEKISESLLNNIEEMVQSFGSLADDEIWSEIYNILSDLKQISFNDEYEIRMIERHGYVDPVYDDEIRNDICDTINGQIASLNNKVEEMNKKITEQCDKIKEAINNIKGGINTLDETVVRMGIEDKADNVGE